jgi:hypothetical protein
MNTDQAALNRLVTALRDWALDGASSAISHAWPLSAVGSENTADDWWGVRPAAQRKMLTRRDGNPAITIYNKRNWQATVMASKTGSSVIVVVPKGTQVIEVTDR